MKRGFQLVGAFVLGALTMSMFHWYPNHSQHSYEQTYLAGERTSFVSVATSQRWDVLVPENSDGGTIALGQSGAVRVVVIDDGLSLYVLTYKDAKSRLFEGRLLDIGNDGTVDVANITGFQCERGKCDSTLDLRSHSTGPAQATPAPAGEFKR